MLEKYVLFILLAVVILLVLRVLNLKKEIKKDQYYTNKGRQIVKSTLGGGDSILNYNYGRYLAHLRLYKALKFFFTPGAIRGKSPKELSDFVGKIEIGGY